MSVDFNGPVCVCGGKGCLEHYASGTSIARRMREKCHSNHQGFDHVDAREVIASWRLLLLVVVWLKQVSYYSRN
jgi:glucokinase